MTAPPWVPDQEIKPASMPLLLVQSFVNTWDGDNGSDLLLDPAAARGWLTGAGLWSVKRAPDPAELHLARPILQVGPSGQISVGPEPADRPDAGLLTLLLVIRDAQRDGTGPRLKACANPDCRWAFYDRSHSRAGAWCDMATCGNRIKNRRLRQRQR